MTMIIYTYIQTDSSTIAIHSFALRFIPNPEFTPEAIQKVSNACEGLCKWVRAMEVYDRVAKVVAPKKAKLAEAEAALAIQMEKLNTKRTELKGVRLKILHLV